MRRQPAEQASSDDAFVDPLSLRVHQGSAHDQRVLVVDRMIVDTRNDPNQWTVHQRRSPRIERRPHEIGYG